MFLVSRSMHECPSASERNQLVIVRLCTSQIYLVLSFATERFARELLSFSNHGREKINYSIKSPKFLEIQTACTGSRIINHIHLSLKYEIFMIHPRQA